MLTMSQINDIKNMYENERLSFEEISKKTGLNWRTVKKYALMKPEHINRKQIRPKRQTALEASGLNQLIDDWLIEDQKVPRKQVRTARRIHLELVKSYNFTGSYRSTADYIKKKKIQLQITKIKKYEHLSSPPGQAQLDYGTYIVVMNGKYIKAHVLILSFKQSNCAVAYAMPSENVESFLHALQMMFIQLGGAPTHIWIDNLAAAVIQIGKGSNRKYQEDFLKFSQFYRFSINPCNAYSGHEKGHVESKVKYIRNRFFVPEPSFSNWDDLNNYLEKVLFEDRKREHYEVNVSHENLWDNDATELLPLPHYHYEIQRFDSRKVDKYSEVMFENTKIYVPYAKPGQIVTFILTWDRYEIIASSGESLTSGFRPFMNKGTQINWIAIFQEWAVKPRSVLYSRHFKHLPSEIQSFLQSVPEAKMGTVTNKMLTILKEKKIQIHEMKSFLITDHQLLELSISLNQLSTGKPATDVLIPSTDLSAYDILLGGQSNGIK